MPRPKSSKTAPKLLARRQLEQRALLLRVKGLSYEDIARRVGRSPAWAWGVVKRRLRLLAGRLREDTERIRHIEMLRLDRLQDGAEQILAAAVKRGDARVALKAQDSLLRVMQQRAALLGLNAPMLLAQVDLTVLSDEQLRQLARGDSPFDVLSRIPTELTAALRRPGRAPVEEDPGEEIN